MSSYDKDQLTVNADGSVEVYVGPDAPTGMEANWIPTARKDFWLVARFYWPQKPLLDKTWAFNDAVRVD